MNDRKCVKIKFGGKTNQIDAKTFLNSLTSFVSIVEEINQEYVTEKKVDVKISAIEKGSFIINLELFGTAYEAFTPLLKKDTILVISQIVATLVGLYELRKFLKGRKPADKTDQNDQVQITNQNGEQKNVNSIVYNFYSSNLSVKEALNNTFESLNSDSSVDDFEIIDDEEATLFQVKKDLFPELTDQDIDENLLPDQQSIRVRTSISLFKIVFDKKYVWEFIYKGNKISAKIDDNNFFKKIDSGEKFAKGDVIEVELEILQEYDESVNTYVNKKYGINKVYDHIPRSEQQNLDF
ncbi:MAG: hypothetical protein WD607_10660 [Candidatus Paceibacterota bacterium]